MTRHIYQEMMVVRSQEAFKNKTVGKSSRRASRNKGVGIGVGSSKRGTGDELMGASYGGDTDAESSRAVGT